MQDVIKIVRLLLAAVSINGLRQADGDSGLQRAPGRMISLPVSLPARMRGWGAKCGTGSRVALRSNISHGRGGTVGAILVMLGPTGNPCVPDRGDDSLLVWGLRDKLTTQLMARAYRIQNQ